MPFTAITGVAYKKKRTRLRSQSERKKKMKRTVEKSREDRKMMLPLINPAESARAEEGIKKSMTSSVITGEELEAHKAEWYAESLNSDSDRLPPWKSKYGAGMEDETQWPPIWKERFEECPEYNVLCNYLIYDLDRCENLAEQIQESRGYDVTDSRCGFCIYTPGMVSESRHISRVICKYVTDQINERAQKHGEFYVYDEAKKIVMPLPFHYLYTFTVKEATSRELKTVQAYVFSQTFCYKNLVYLMEWRFRPE